MSHQHCPKFLVLQYSEMIYVIKIIANCVGQVSQGK